jgi:hypothetical protein
MNLNQFYHSEEVINYKINAITKEEFRNKFIKFKPEYLFNKQYSNKIPCWYFSNFKPDGCEYYAHAWADKTPKFKSYEELYNRLSVDGGITNLFYNTDIDLLDKVELNLIGLDGNAYSLMGAFEAEARKQGWEKFEIQQVLRKCKESNYDNLLRVLMEYTASTI